MSARAHVGLPTGRGWFARVGIVLVAAAFLLGFLLPSAALAAPIPAPYDCNVPHVWGDTGVSGVVLFDTGTPNIAYANPTVPASFTITGKYTILSITNYHYGYTLPSGTIGLLDQNNATVGSWPMAWYLGSPYFWYVRPNITIGPGTYTVTDSSVATWSWTWGAYPSDYMGMTRVVAVAVPNNAPVMTSAAITSSDAPRALETSVLTASGLATDPDSDPLTYEYEWFVNGSTTGQTTPTLSGTYFSRGDSVTCSIRAFDGIDYSAWLESSPVTLGNSAPVITSDGGSAAATVFIHSCAGVITDVDATDPDPGDILTYSIVGTRFSPVLRMFVIDPMTGVLSFSARATNVRMVRYGTTPFAYALGKITVKVTDSGRPALSDTQVLTIMLALDDD